MNKGNSVRSATLIDADEEQRQLILNNLDDAFDVVGNQ